LDGDYSDFDDAEHVEAQHSVPPMHLRRTGTE
jgi:hypothetical protein